MVSKKISWFSYALKVIVLFCFMYDFVFFLLPTPLLSSRKIAFFLVLLYFVGNGYSLKSFMKDSTYRNLLSTCLICTFYILFLNITIKTNGISALGNFVFFILYSFLGVFLFASFFNWNYEKLIKALAIITLFQATWSILTFYFLEFRLINDALFVIDKDENIDFLSETRLRSIGGAGSSLSVCISLSSFSFLYFIIKGERVILNIICYFYCGFATLLAGTTGIIISICALFLTFMYSFKFGRQKYIYFLFIPLVLYLFLHVMGSVLDDYQYRHLTEKLVGFYEDGADNRTFELLRDQRVSGISAETIIGTGITRGRAMGLICFHDSGYIRNYFALGLVMAIVFYSSLYWTMWQLARRAKGPSFTGLLLIFLSIVMITEYKEPYLFYYYPFFIFNALALTVKSTKVSRI